jgi:transmembrane sensor
MTERPVERVLEATLKDLRSGRLQLESNVVETGQVQQHEHGDRCRDRTGGDRPLHSDMRDLVATSMGWLIRTETAECTPELRKAFLQWIEVDVRHRVAATIARRSRERIDRLGSVRPLGGGVDPDLLAAPQNVPMALDIARPAELDVPASPKTANAKLNLRLLAGVVGICTAAISGWYASDHSRWESYVTAIGGKETAPLPDGTSVILNTDSTLRVRLTSGARELELVRGEAIIKTRPNERRPLRLVAGRVIVDTTDAEFEIRKWDSDRVDLMVAAGRVTAQTAPGGLFGRWFQSTTAEQAEVSVGYMATIVPDGVQISRVGADERERKMAWLRDAVEFQGETVADAVEELNRYNRRQIVIEDPAVARRSVAGVFPDTDPDSFVAAIARTMNVKATTIGGEEGPGYGKILVSSRQAAR